MNLESKCMEVTCVMEEGSLRSASIMSSKAAPGVIMATGVMGKSLKGIPGVYLSRDAGLTWKRILKDYYFFNYGDHGGVIVAVKYFKIRGETRKILYSTNEGIDWHSYQFNADDLRIYGLMTEPGENTTTFTMFGSSNDRHQWIIITIDLKNAFERNCTQEDYKFWSPSPPNSTVSCVLGMKETFQRRYPYANCYNGIDYARPVKKETCECTRKDYECEYSFHLSGKECVRNKTMKFDAYRTPPECSPGVVYKRTKGYKRIDGDVCHSSSYIPYEPELVPCPLEETSEFILVALKDKIARIDLADNTTIYPVKNQRHVVALEFDMKNNCIYWGDIEVDKIMRQCFANGSEAEEIIVESELSSIEGMALDWISNVLFFVDGTRKKIEAVRTDLTNAGRMRTTILDSKVLSKPRGIAVHPKAGYLFWTDWDKLKPSISRSNLDGTDIKKLFEAPIVEWPNGITIDHTAERIYWVDAMEDYIASSDLNGHYFRRILWSDEKVSHPFAVAVLRDKMYWDDWKAKSIFIADKNSGSNVITINDSFSGLMDLKVFAHFIQHGSNACHDHEYHKCDTICLGKPGGFSCLCPDGFAKKDNKCICPNGMEPAANMTCPQKAGSCVSNEFTCKNGLCISSIWRCDGNDDCGDQSDEVDCLVCSPPMVACDWDQRCYMPHWRCDGDYDCTDMSDEKDCEPRNCSANQFKCSNGHCIDKKWQCDGENDCKDNSDEQNCHVPSRRPDTISCSGSGFICSNSSKLLCIPNSWVCDGEPDCPGGEDEIRDRCRNSTCSPHMFHCPNGKCIFKSWVCDGENDCGDDEKSDEKNCETTDKSKIIPRPSTDKPAIFLVNTTCLDWMFKCDNGNCLPYWWRCDGINDCGDRSDEIGCGFTVTEPVTPTPSSGDSRRTRCSRNEFSCSPGVCIPLSWVCDMADDCPGGEDERGCARRDGAAPVCASDETPCADGRGCVRDTAICDGTPDCFDRSDETHCPSYIFKTPVTECPPDFVLCNDGLMCINSNAVCNGEKDCDDNSDETNCSNTINKFVNLLLGIDVNHFSINSSSFVVSCWLYPKAVAYTFLPSISKVSDGVWHNMTWSKDCAYRFTNLEPYTQYNVTFYVQDKLNTTLPLTKYINLTTTEGVPSPPTRLTVRQMVGRRLNVEWDPPKQPNGVIKSYILSYEPPIPRVESRFTHNNVTIEGYFVPNKKYTFRVRAMNDVFISNMSEPAVIMFDEVGDVDDLNGLSNVTMKRLNASAVSLVWHELRGVDGYLVVVRPPDEYAHPPNITTKDTNITLTNLPTGVEIIFSIQAYKGQTYGTPFTMTIHTPGEKDEMLNVAVALIENRSTAVQVSWSRPTSDRYKGKFLEYEVLYNRTALGYDGVFSSKPIITPNTSLVIDGLHACESYFFTAGIRGGPLPVAGKLEVITKENPKAPVKDLRVEIQQNSTMKIKWNASCDALKDAVKYKLKITEKTRNVTSRYIIKPSKSSNLEHMIQNVPQGGRYNICVNCISVGYVNGIGIKGETGIEVEGGFQIGTKTGIELGIANVDVPDAVVVCAGVRSPPIPTPQNVVAWLDDSGHVMVSWHPIHALDHDEYKYEILISKNELAVDLLHPDEDVKVVQAERPPVLSFTEPASQLFVAVRVRSSHGYYSDLSEVRTLTMQGVAAEPRTSAGAIWWGMSAASVAAIALVAALLHLALRHRRLARSFLRFTAATPRYDSRRGQATLGDHDDDDVPPIHGFSDDEPLVIA
ncbi:Sortilin-related receptor [Eumeta japonica]|uniref:Sortilin-related receptor n=1 Tax=Eumeta variegata TaxID=151549 RepID=A0A4C1UC36_EUMVA|nr:Sortilin-related receptor [Eumeta japonica]